jgi:hypothetical protein
LATRHDGPTITFTWDRSQDVFQQQQRTHPILNLTFVYSNKILAPSPRTTHSSIPLWLAPGYVYSHRVDIPHCVSVHRVDIPHCVSVHRVDIPH